MAATLLNRFRFFFLFTGVSMYVFFSVPFKTKLRCDIEAIQTIKERNNLPAVSVAIIERTSLGS